MLKVFLVEDEFIVREGIKNNIDWSGAGFKFCGDASDGELAYPLIQTEQPDIIITDIRMPFMDGLELSRLVKKELPQSKIIVLSGHEEFSYAQEAIRIGVTEYLLKPINGAELIKVVKRVGEQIIHERVEKENFERYKREMEENEIDVRRRFFN
ncbi:MAG: response regulator, partial [Bacillota bacterium]|nr:response regulator [Bacillota bacterium]